MKPKLLILTFLIAALGIKSQRAFDLTSHWTTITTNGFYNSTKIISYDIVGDTIINNIKYSKLYQDNVYFCGLRMADDKKLYYIISPDSGSDKELLAYDFDWVEGKDLLCQGLSNNAEIRLYATTIHLDSIKLLDNKYYKCIKNTGWGYVDDIRCIQGIGDMHGFFFYHFGQLMNGDFINVLCFWKGNQLIYSNPEYNYCTVSATDNDIKAENKVCVYQATDGSTIFQLLGNIAMETQRIDIYNEMGMLVRTLKVDATKSVRIDKLASGIYFYKIRSEKRQSSRAKFIVHN